MLRYQTEMMRISLRGFCNKGVIPKKVTTHDYAQFRKQGRKIAVVTAYDYPSGRHCEAVGFEMVLVGDSLGMVVLGYDNTCPVTMNDMLYHCRAVRRGAPTSFIVGDMPFGSYESGPEEALKNAFRFMKEGGVDGIKLEGAGSRVETVRKLVESGIPVCGHIGLTPQGVNVIGGFKAQGRTAESALQIVEDALALEQAGAFAIVIECVPSIVAKAVTDAVKIPTIGIGAGADTTGQVLVYHDLLGMNYHDGGSKPLAPSFCKLYANLGEVIQSSLKQYKADVIDGTFPSSAYDSYKMSGSELIVLEAKKQSRTLALKTSTHENDDFIQVY